jgi:hypothetical protein
MRVRRVMVVAALTWVLVVLVGSTLVWAVISHAGREVVSGEAPVLSRSATTSPKSSQPTVRDGETIKPRKTQRPTKEPSSAGTGSGTPSSSSAPSSKPPSSSHSAGPSGGPSGGGPSGPQATRRTWNGAAGSVVVECTGASMTANSATPNSGWGVEAQKEGGTFQVHFHQTSGGKEVELSATCVGGTPRFDSHGDGDSRYRGDGGNERD